MGRYVGADGNYVMVEVLPHVGVSFVTNNNPINKIKSKRRRRRRGKQLLNDIKGKEKVLEFERGMARSQSLVNSLWKRG